MKICQPLNKLGAKYSDKISFYIILAIEILTVILTSIGVFPREAILAMTGLLIFYFIFSKVEDSLILFIISIPLFAALPISEKFDSMANWRILLAILFLVWFIKKYFSLPSTSILHSIEVVKNETKNSIKKARKSSLGLLGLFVLLFLIVGILSLFVATDIIVGIKKILFLINIFLLFIVVQDIAKNREMRPRIIKAGAIAGAISLIVSYSQLIFVFLTPLYNFWQWWAKNVISVFYGSNLAKLLAVSNTWFSYYSDSPPTLRMFSVFPDSHSFALFTIISLAFFSYLLFKKNKKIWFLIIFSFLALVFCGSRGVWLSAAIPFGIILILFIYSFFKRKDVGHSTSHTTSHITHLARNNSRLIRTFIGFLLIFVVAFPVASLFMSQFSRGGDGTLAFKRAKSITDMEELSVKNRMGIWKTSFQSVLKHPILGVGIGNYPIVLDEDISAAKKGASAHNLYLDVASEMGLLGLIVLLLIFWQILKTATKYIKHFKDQTFPAIFTFFFLWLLIYNLFDVVLLNDKVLLLFMVILGLIYSINGNKLRNNSYE